MRHHRYHKTNSGLDLLISNLKLKQNGLQSEVLSQRKGKADSEQQLKRMQHDLQQVIPFIQEPKQLKEKVKALYQKYCGEGSTGGEEEGDLEREAARQREYLEKTVDSLKRKLAKDSELHRTDNLRIMQENTALIKEINELRREIKSLRARVAGGAPVGGMAATAGRTGGRAGSPMSPELLDGLKRELEMQRDLISRLREDVAVKDTRIKQLEGMVVPRPMSRERLPPMDGFAAGGGAAVPTLTKADSMSHMSRQDTPVGGDPVGDMGLQRLGSQAAAGGMDLQPSEVEVA